MCNICCGVNRIGSAFSSFVLFFAVDYTKAFFVQVRENANDMIGLLKDKVHSIAVSLTLFSLGLNSISVLLSKEKFTFNSVKKIENVKNFQLKERLGRFTPREIRRFSSKKSYPLYDYGALSFDTKQWVDESGEENAEVTLFLHIHHTTYNDELNK